MHIHTHKSHYFSNLIEAFIWVLFGISSLMFFCDQEKTWRNNGKICPKSADFLMSLFHLSWFSKGVHEAHLRLYHQMVCNPGLKKKICVGLGPPPEGSAGIL